MENMRYTYKCFRDSMPEWKRKKDPLNCRYFIRPLSFYGAAFAANHGITANEVSYFSLIVAAISCIFYFINLPMFPILGAILMNIWLWLDCVDGNLARSVKKQPFGEFADAISSYVLVAFMGVAFGYSVFMNGGVFVKAGNQWMIVAGALSSVFDTSVRLIYQKYKNVEAELVSKGLIHAEKDEHIDISQVGTFRVWFEHTWGIGGWLPHFILAATLFRALDIIVLYCFLFYGISFFGGAFVYIRKAINRAAGIDILPHNLGSGMK